MGWRIFEQARGLPREHTPAASFRNPISTVLLGVIQSSKKPSGQEVKRAKWWDEMTGATSLWVSELTVALAIVIFKRFREQILACL